MIFDYKNYKYYIKPGNTNGRMGWKTLVEQVETVMKKSLSEKNMFLFCNCTRNSIRILVWDNGYWVIQKRLVKGTFKWPNNEKEAEEISVEDVKRLLEGQDIFRRIEEVEKAPVW